MQDGFPGAGYLMNPYYIDSKEKLVEQAEKFRTMVIQARKRGAFSASEFEYKMLNKALEDGPEQVAQVVKRFTPDSEQKHMLRLAEQAYLILPFIIKDELLSDWAHNKLKKYLTKGRLQGTCEIKLQKMIEAMTESFIINALIKATRDDGQWEKIIGDMKENFDRLTKCGSA